MQQIKILHITPHLGGGIGKVLLNYVIHEKENYNFSHKIVCLDYANDYAKEVAKKEGIFLKDWLSEKNEELLRMIEETDIVLIHWINNPFLYNFMVRQTLPPCRVIVWSHVSGLHPPNIFTKPLIAYADLFVFTTSISFEAEEIKEMNGLNKGKIRTIWSTGGLENVENVKKRNHKGFNVGYLGTVDYCKLHPDFLEMSASVDVDDIKFIVVGTGNEKEIKKEATGKGLTDKFKFTGFVDDIKEYLAIFDVFGYPLAPYHYGTCDQVLAEAMACGIVPVVMANKMEKSMVVDGVTGLIATDKKSYADAIKRLHDDQAMRKRLSENTKRIAKASFSLDKMSAEWDVVFNECLSIEKRKRKWAGKFNGKDVSPSEVFLESIGAYGKIFQKNLNGRDMRINILVESPLWQAKTKGTAHHYCSFFKDDSTLLKFKKMMEKKTNE
jgi:glycosyltransferase involved in cell wall biosynthesis